MNTRASSFLYSDNASFVEELYESYLDDREAVTPGWRDYFDELAKSRGAAKPDVAHSKVVKAFHVLATRHEPRAPSAAAESLSATARKQVAVLQLINAYRFRGHRQADLDPLRQYERPDVADLDPAFHGLSEEDLDTVFNTGSLYGPAEATLGEILQTVRQTYCGCIGAEYMHINETAQKRWIQQHLELKR